MFATIMCERKLQGTSKAGKDYNIVNFVITECKSVPFLIGQRFGVFCNENDWEWLNIDERKAYEVDLQLYPNRKEYANLHYSISSTGYKLVNVSND